MNHCTLLVKNVASGPITRQGFWPVLLWGRVSGGLNNAAGSDWPSVPLPEECGCPSVHFHSRCDSRFLSDWLQWCGFLVLTQTRASGLQWPEKQGEARGGGEREGTLKFATLEFNTCEFCLEINKESIFPSKKEETKQNVIMENRQADKVGGGGE